MPLCSYSGSSIYYWAIYDFHETKPDGEHVADTICDETIDTPMRFRSPRNSLVYKTGQNVACTYFLSAPRHQFSRLQLRVDPVDFHKESDTCADSCMGNKALDRVEVVEEVGEENVTKACLSACQPPHTTTIISLTSNLRLSLFLVGATAPSLYYTRKPPLFTAEVSYLHPPICGPTYISAVDSGFLLFPILPKGEGTHYREVECLWDLDTRPEIPISLTIGTYIENWVICRCRKCEFVGRRLWTAQHSPCQGGWRGFPHRVRTNPRKDQGLIATC